MKIIRGRLLDPVNSEPNNGLLEALKCQKYLIKTPKAWAVDVPESTSSTSISFGLEVYENRYLRYLAQEVQS